MLCCVRWYVSLHRSHTQACRHGRGDAPVEAAARRAGAHVVGRLLLGRHGLLFLCVVEEGRGRENEAPGAGLCCGVMVAVYRRGQSAAAAGSRHRDQVKLPSPNKKEANKTAWPLHPIPPDRPLHSSPQGQQGGKRGSRGTGRHCLTRRVPVNRAAGGHQQAAKAALPARERGGLALASSTRSKKQGRPSGVCD